MTLLHHSILLSDNSNRPFARSSLDTINLRPMRIDVEIICDIKGAGRAIDIL